MLVDGGRAPILGLVNLTKMTNENREMTVVKYPPVERQHDTAVYCLSANYGGVA